MFPTPTDNSGHSGPRVDANAHSEPFGGQVGDREMDQIAHKRHGHVGDVLGVFVPIPLENNWLPMKNDLKFKHLWGNPETQR